MSSAREGRRRSLFSAPLAALTPLHSSEHHPAGHKPLPKTLRKVRHARAPSLQTNIDHPAVGKEAETEIKSAPAEDPRTMRPGVKSSLKRPPSGVFSSLRSSTRSHSDDSAGHDGSPEPMSAASSTAPSIGLPDSDVEVAAHPKTVLLHGEVQTSAGMFRKKKEYLVLTEAHILRYKSQSKAAETFKAIPHPVGRSPTVRHGSMPSIGSQSDLQTLSDHSGDKDGRVPLRQVVAVHRLDDGKPYFALEVCFLDEESGHASSMTLQFANPEERDIWLRKIRRAVNEVKQRGLTAIAAYNVENAARIVERYNDYDPANCAIFKIVQRARAEKSSNRSSSDDVTKVASTVCFLAIGVHKVHLVQLSKGGPRSSSPFLAPNTAQTFHGILTLTAVRVSSDDDAFELTFRQPMQSPRTLYLASSASYEIAARLLYAENYLRPECAHRLFRFIAPAGVEDLLEPPVESNEENSCLDRTLIAYCVAYGVNPAHIRYTINYTCEDAPRFELLPPADGRRPEYGPIELMAIMRALRYNESFGSMSFAGIPLDGLNGLHDNYGQEHVCSRTKRGTPIKLTAEELGRSCLLVQEVRALAATSKKLRRMDFSQCVTANVSVPMESSEDDGTKVKDLGCGIVEALFPLCKHQTTNVDWICLNGINLSETDLDYLVGAAVEKSCHFRTIELNRCGLNDRSMGLILDALRAQDNTLEALEIAGNTARINPVTFDGQLGMFGFIRKLNLSYASRTSGNEPFLQAETLLIWRLQELRLSGTALNGATIDAIATYLAHPQSTSLHELYIDNAYLSGSDVATLLHSMSHDSRVSRDLHLDISQNYIHKGLEQVTQAIAEGLAPSHLTMRAIDYREESLFRKMLAALTTNKTIRYLDMSQVALPGDASEDTCRALERLFAENDTLLELDISGEDSRLASSKFGNGINQALVGLKHNKTLQSFRVEKQKLGLQGSSTLAEVLKENTTLRELYCDNNEIPLQGLTDLVNSLVDNTTIIYLPPMNDGRAAAFRSAELTMKGLPDVEPVPSRTSTFPKPSPLGSSSVVKRGLASVRRSAVRSASAYTPSFPALPSYGRTNSSPDSRTPSFSLTLPASKAKPSPQAASPAQMSFTVQDIQITHRLLEEQWDRQVYRLGRYLDRNWCLLNNVPVDLQVEDEKFERPDSVGSIGKVLQQVKHDTTPRAEKPLYFDQNEVAHGEMTEKDPAADPHDSAGPLDEKQQMSFKQFLLGSGPTTPDYESEGDMEAKMKRLKLDTNLDGLEEPRTPTQKAFTAAT
jgi:hypothetical protein